MNADIAIIGAGVLGIGMAYFLARLNPNKRILVIERESEVARHASSRNTGKVHAPYLYDPRKKRTLARAAFMGFDMWKTYAGLSGQQFKKDGIIEVACDKADEEVLKKYVKWGRMNGLEEGEIEILDHVQIKRREPAVRCHSAIFCSRDASVDYGMLCMALKADCQQAGASFVLGSRAIGISRKGDDIQIRLDNAATIHAKFVINAAGGEAVDIAHKLGTAYDLVDVHFRGEYWQAPPEYDRLASTSVYSVPRFPEYPFLDPHWVVRADRSCQVGPNAVPIFDPYGYDNVTNIREFIPKMLEMLGSGARRALFDGRFQSLAASEIASSLSKHAMINRVKRFIPLIDPAKFTQKAAAGIRSPVINSRGEFEADVILKDQEKSQSVLNYNSPGASGALPFCAHVIYRMHDDGRLRYDTSVDTCGPWKFSEIIAGMHDCV